MSSSVGPRRSLLAVPHLISVRVAEAVALLDELGLAYELHRVADEGSVIVAQDPLPGQPIEEDGRVLLITEPLQVETT